jgi:hypothetical protein
MMHDRVTLIVTTITNAFGDGSSEMEHMGGNFATRVISVLVEGAFAECCNNPKYKYDVLHNL